MYKTLAFFLLFFVFTGITNAQNETVRQFWKSVSIEYNLNEMDASTKAILYNLAQRQTNSYTKTLALLENIDNNPSFQDYMFLEIYTTLSDREFMRMVLGNMCGSYSLGNKIGNYILNKYVNDPRAIKKIRIKHELEVAQKNAELEEQKKNEAEAIESYKTKIFSLNELDQDINPKNIEEVRKMLDLQIIKYLDSGKLKQYDDYDRGRIFGFYPTAAIVDSNGNTTFTQWDDKYCFGFENNENEILFTDILSTFSYIKFDIPKHKGYSVKCEYMLPINRAYSTRQQEFKILEDGSILTVEGNMKRKIDKENLVYKPIIDTLSTLKEKGTYQIEFLMCGTDYQKSYDESSYWRPLKILKIYNVILVPKQ